MFLVRGIYHRELIVVDILCCPSKIVCGGSLGFEFGDPGTSMARFHCVLMTRNNSLQYCRAVASIRNAKVLINPNLLTVPR